jgi:hypothetical protein
MLKGMSYRLNWMVRILMGRAKSRSEIVRWGYIVNNLSMQRSVRKSEHTLSNIEPCWTNVAPWAPNSNLFFSIRSDNSAIVNNTRKSRKIHTKSVKDENLSKCSTKCMPMRQKMYGTCRIPSARTRTQHSNWGRYKTERTRSDWENYTRSEYTVEVDWS